MSPTTPLNVSPWAPASPSTTSSSSSAPCPPRASGSSASECHASLHASGVASNVHRFQHIIYLLLAQFVWRVTKMSLRTLLNWRPLLTTAIEGQNGRVLWRVDCDTQKADRLNASNR